MNANPNRFVKSKYSRMGYRDSAATRRFTRKAERRYFKVLVQQYAARP